MTRPESLLLLAALVATTWLLVRARIRHAQQVIDDARRFDLDDCVSKRPEDEDEAAWAEEYRMWRLEQRTKRPEQPYDVDADGGI